jgi:hypothetical protein
MTRSAPPAAHFLIFAGLVTATAFALAGIATFIAADYYRARLTPPAVVHFAEADGR